MFAIAALLFVGIAVFLGQQKESWFLVVLSMFTSVFMFACATLVG